MADIFEIEDYRPKNSSPVYTFTEDELVDFVQEWIEGLVTPQELQEICRRIEETDYGK